MNEKADFSEFDSAGMNFSSAVIEAQINQMISHVKVRFYGNKRDKHQGYGVNNYYNIISCTRKS